MIHVAWRKLRLNIIVIAAAAAALMIYMAVNGHAAEVDRALALHLGCAIRGLRTRAFDVPLTSGTAACGVLSTHLSSDASQASLIRVLLYALPCFSGVVAGASLVALELERKTNRLAWTQGVSRTRWFASAAAVAAVGAVVPVAAVMALVPWWRNVVQFWNVLAPANFGITGVVMVSYTLFAVALGVALGALLRRVSLSIVGTMVVYGIVNPLIARLWRPWYLTPLRYVPWLTRAASTFPGLSHGPAFGSLTTGSGLVGRHGVTVGAVYDACQRHPANACLQAHGVLYVIYYQPPSRYWPFQWIESGIYAAMALALLVGALWLVRRWRA